MSIFLEKFALKGIWCTCKPTRVLSWESWQQPLETTQFMLHLINKPFVLSYTPCSHLFIFVYIYKKVSKGKGKTRIHEYENQEKEVLKGQTGGMTTTLTFQCKDKKRKSQPLTFFVVQCFLSSVLEPLVLLHCLLLLKPKSKSCKTFQRHKKMTLSLPSCFNISCSH